MLGVPAAAAAAGPAPSTSVAHHATALHPGGDVVLRSGPTAAARTATRDGSLTKLSAPASLHLLAARVYWGERHPARPSATRMRKDLRRTADYYAEVSRGREHLHTTLTRWVHVNVSGDVMCNTQGRSLRAATRALRRAGYHPGRFDRLMIFTEQCNAAASVAQLPGRVSWIRFRAPGMATLVHELGHNLGLEHAYGVVCRKAGRRVALGGRCHPVEYGDSWDAMGHSRGSFSAPALVRLGWAGTIRTVRRSGTFDVADVAHSGSANQALKIPAGRTTYWVEYQPEHSPQVGRTIPGVMIRRQVGHGPVEMIDASPGNPVGIAYPDRDLTNPALPVGSSLTTPEDIRITTLATGRHASVRVTFARVPGVPASPVLDEAAPNGSGDYRVRWTAPTDHGQIVLGYLVTEEPSGRTQFVRSPGSYRTSAAFPVDKAATAPPSFTIRALNQEGWSAPSAPVAATG